MARPRKQTTEQEFEKYETYTPPSSYELPREVREAFENQGLSLRFVRVILDNKEDYKNVSDKRREGYEFVTISELPHHLRSMFETKSFGSAQAKFSDIVMVGDLALMKIPEGKKRARQRYYENMALQTELAQTANLSKDSKMNRLLPIVNESETVVRTGGRKSASDAGFGKTLQNPQEEESEEE